MRKAILVFVGYASGNALINDLRFTEIEVELPPEGLTSAFLKKHRDDRGGTLLNVIHLDD